MEKAIFEQKVVAKKSTIIKSPEMEKLKFIDLFCGIKKNGLIIIHLCFHNY